MEGIIGLDRKAIIIASIVVGFNFENRFQDYHAVDFLGHFDDSNIPVNVDDQRIIAWQIYFCRACKRSLEEIDFFITITYCLQ